MTSLWASSPAAAICPARWRKARAHAGRAVFVVALRGMRGDDWVEEFPHEWVSLGEPGRAFKALTGAGAGDVLLAGRVDRPKFSELKLDAKGMHDAAARDRGGAQGR